MFNKVIRILILMTMIAATFAYPNVATADDLSDTKGFRKGVTLAGIREHQLALQEIANANNSTRQAGTPGYDASAQYVYDRMAAAGYNVSLQEFPFAYFEELSPSEMEQTAPASVTYTNGVDFLTMDYSGSGDVTASVTAVDVVLALPRNPVTSGCEATDFAGFPAGNIALLQRGTCTFGLKATNAEAAGAVGVIIFNQGNTPAREPLFGGTLGAPVGIPALSVSFALGAALATTPGLEMHMVTDTISEIRTTTNVIAETPSGDPNRVVVVGAHLDSVGAGPGINDNGSGSATILEVAEVYAEQGRVSRNKLRFMWYGAEESGLLGSTFYVNSLSQAERDQIEMMLNFDMIGSPNFFRGVYDGDNSAFPPVPGQVQPGPPGSGTIEQVFVDYFNSQGLFNEPTPFSGRSDYGPFITIAGIPAGGLFTGAEGLKTAAQVEQYGGIAGAQYDPCYHQACDTFANNSNTALDQMSDAVAHAVLLFSKRNFAKDPLATPVVASTGGNSGTSGGFHNDHHDAVTE